MRVDVDRAKYEFLVLGDNAREVVHNTDIVIADNPECDGILRGPFTAPLSLDHAIAVTASQFWGVRTILPVNLDTAIDGDKAEDWITIDWMTTACQLVVQALQILVDDERPRL